MSTTDIVLELSRIGRELDHLAREIDTLDRAAVYAKSEYRKAFAVAFTTGTGSVKDREQQAVLAVEHVRLDSELADQVLRATHEKIRVLRNRLDIGRSLGAARRSEFAAEYVGQTT